jgi:Putative transposase
LVTFPTETPAAVAIWERTSVLSASVNFDEPLVRPPARWWSIKIQSFEDKWHFLQYAGRYVRRPPIAQRRITWIGNQTVRFWYKDKKLRRRAEVQCSLEEFVDRWTQHIPERYQHAVRSFGLFAPRALAGCGKRGVATQTLSSFSIV